jgi:hypothetical protein
MTGLKFGPYKGIRRDTDVAFEFPAKMGGLFESQRISRLLDTQPTHKESLCFFKAIRVEQGLRRLIEGVPAVSL